MKRIITINLIALFMVTGIGCKPSNATSDLITVDVTANYPKKELILQDYMDVEYIPLETNDEFITQGVIRAIGNTYLLVTNRNNDGDIFVFDRKTGKGIRKINRKGQGAEEYIYITGIILDEDNNEMFLNSSSINKILVYDLLGNFKRSFDHADGGQYFEMHNFDKNNLICYDTSGYMLEGKERNKQAYHVIISKKDGSITKGLPIPFDVIRSPMVNKGDGFAVAHIRAIVPYHHDWLLVEISSDTVYRYAPKEEKLTPFLVKPPVEDTEMLLTMGTITDQFYFLQIIKKDFDFEKGRGFESTDLMYDRQENAWFNATVFNGDYIKKQTVNITFYPVNTEVLTYQSLAADRIVGAYEKEELKGKLKEIAAKLDEESNPVIMIIKNKK